MLNYMYFSVTYVCLSLRSPAVNRFFFFRFFYLIRAIIFIFSILDLISIQDITYTDLSLLTRCHATLVHPLSAQNGFCSFSFIALIELYLH